METAVWIFLAPVWLPMLVLSVLWSIACWGLVIAESVRAVKRLFA